MSNAKARLVAYLAAIALGAFMTVWGVIHGDAATITAGIGLVGTGSLAAPNVTDSGGDQAG